MLRVRATLRNILGMRRLSIARILVKNQVLTATQKIELALRNRFLCTQNFASPFYAPVRWL